MTPDDLPDPETAAADAADDAHTERWREERARGGPHEVECPWLTDGCASRGRLHRPLKGGTDDDICIECLESCCCGALRKHGARVRADERDKAAGRVERLTAYRAIEECEGSPLENADPNHPDPYLQGHLLERDDTLAAIREGGA